MLKTIAGVTLAFGLGVTAVQAEPMTSQAARKQLFSSSEMVLKPLDMKVFDSSVRRMARQLVNGLREDDALKKLLAAGYGYYGAVAFPVSTKQEATPTIITQLNSPEAAQVAAIEACQQATGTQCALAAILVPRGYQQRDLTLSQAATDRLQNDWDDGVGPSYLAASPTSSAWGVAKGPSASARTAVESCNRSDCVVVVADE